MFAARVRGLNVRTSDLFLIDLERSAPFSGSFSPLLDSGFPGFPTVAEITYAKERIV
jgi:hypothetical protein